MQQLIISSKNWDEFQRIANEYHLGGVDETLEYLFSLAHKEDGPEVALSPTRIKRMDG